MVLLFQDGSDYSGSLDCPSEFLTHQFLQSSELAGIWDYKEALNPSLKLPFVRYLVPAIRKVTSSGSIRENAVMLASLAVSSST